jgi:hypothetical protein
MHPHPAQDPQEKGTEKFLGEATDTLHEKLQNRGLLTSYALFTNPHSAWTSLCPSDAVLVLTSCQSHLDPSCVRAVWSDSGAGDVTWLLFHVI